MSVNSGPHINFNVWAIGNGWERDIIIKVDPNSASRLSKHDKDSYVIRYTREMRDAFMKLHRKVEDRRKLTKYGTNKEDCYDLLDILGIEGLSQESAYGQSVAMEVAQFFWSELN